MDLWRQVELGGAKRDVGYDCAVGKMAAASSTKQ